MAQALDIVNTFMQSQDTAFLADDFRFTGPVDQTTGTSLTLNIADWVIVKNGKMVEERLYYDAREFAAAFGR